jgi:phosphodiesterase/alkaline phosphatase D-like protein
LKQVPQQTYITFDEGVNMMRATWVTFGQTASIVQWGVHHDNLTKSNSGHTTTYTEGGWLGTIHHSTMQDLVPRTRYWYRVGDGNLWSPTISFLMPDLSSYPLRVAMVADLGYGNS